MKRSFITHATNPNLRFWFYHRQGWVKITLRQGQMLRHSYRYDNGEGTSFESAQFEYIAGPEPGILQTWCNGGRDCDGYTQRDGQLYADARELRAVRAYDGGTMDHLHAGAHIMRPDWQEQGNVRCYDQYAQLAGY